MGEVIHISDSNSDNIQQHTDLEALTEELLIEVRNDDIPLDRSLRIPIGKLSSLGAGVATLIPAINTVTQTTSINATGLYQLANQSSGDVLKLAKNGNFWGAFKTSNGGSKFLQLKEADPISVSNKMVMHANPATMMMAVALYSIEAEIGNIEEMEKQILSFLELEKEAEIEADVKTVSEIITRYKDNWDNERYIASNLVVLGTLKRNARKNMIASQKRVSETLEEKHLFVAGSKVDSVLKVLVKRFKYYRLALYTYALSSLTEIMLSGNFKEENIHIAIDEIEKNSTLYRDLFGRSSLYLEKMTGGALELHIMKGVGAVSGAIGKVIGSIPKVKDGKVDEFLLEKGQKIEGQATGISDDIIQSFAMVSNPSTGGLLQILRDMDQIYNHTTEICFDKENLYLIAG